ncbi:dedicator of cytokinesis protein 11-like [Coregonus clupeaformis]|uniref:dedicator of cytokinesis protein 11-like n=1 Tax=Coregonus clupeaformis TaxID=59861 RepID=UPI001E1C508E|nr:dedicator of cytokinesis protein 11-like [Coregonus clupeaformis]
MYRTDLHLHSFFQHYQLMRSSSEGNPAELIKSLKYVFVTNNQVSGNSGTTHEVLATAITAILKQTADFNTSNKLLKYSWFFFETMAKSMAQYLQEGNRIKRCLTFMNRGFAFSLVNDYMCGFTLKDPKVLTEMKFDFLMTVCNHEHSTTSRSTCPWPSAAPSCRECRNQQARICLLYLPLLELLYQNLKQLSAQQHTSSPGLGLTGSIDYLRSTSSMDSRRTSMAIDKDHGPVAQNGHLVRREDSRGSLFMDLGTPNSSELHRRGSELHRRGSTMSSSTTLPSIGKLGHYEIEGLTSSGPSQKTSCWPTGTRSTLRTSSTSSVY